MAPNWEKRPPQKWCRRQSQHISTVEKWQDLPPLARMRGGALVPSGGVSTSRTGLPRIEAVHDFPPMRARLLLKEISLSLGSSV
jgi:hypothetical protein